MYRDGVSFRPRAVKCTPDSCGPDPELFSESLYCGALDVSICDHSLLSRVEAHRPAERDTEFLGAADTCLCPRHDQRAFELREPGHYSEQQLPVRCSRVAPAV